jgi:asparagine synthase (glutamine-hydrolysing)
MTTSMRSAGFCLFGAALRPRAEAAYAVIPDALWSRHPLPPAGTEGDPLVFFSGHLFNRAELERRAGAAAGAPVPQTIAGLYRSAGPRALDALDGYFALAVVDVARRTVLAARDGSDLEFVFYANLEGGLERLVVADNVPDVLALVGAVVEEPALAEYFIFGQLGGAQTLFRGVRRLRLGETLACDPAGGRLDRSRYRELVAIPQDSRASETELVDRVDAALRERLRTACADAPAVVNTLSGGVDSSLLQWALVEAGHRRSVSVVMEGAEDRHEYARTVARLLGCAHTCHTVSGDELAAAIEEGTRLSALPGTFGGEAAAIVLYQRLAAESPRPPYLVGGDVGDKVFGDGPALLALHAYDVGLPRRVVDVALGALVGRRHPGYRGLSAALGAERVEPGLVARLWGNEERERRVARLLGTDSVAHAYASRAEIASDVRGPLGHRIWVTRALTSDSRCRILWLKNLTARAHGVRLIEPFADLPLLETMWHVPNRLKLRRFTEKYLEKKLLRRRLPKPVVMQAKVSNATPYGPIMRASARLRALVEELRESRPPCLPGFADHVAWCIARAERDDTIDGDLLLALNFHLWHETWIRQRHAPAERASR